jgi:hypothetical protein
VARLTLGGTDYDICPYRLREVRLAAPHIDRVIARARSGDLSLEAMTAAALDMLAALAVGIPDVTAEQLEAAMAIADLPAVRDAFNAMLEEAGFTAAGEAQPASAPAVPPKVAPSATA